MKAVLLQGYGGVDQLSYQDAPQPEPQNGEVLVKVAAASINPVDWKLRRGDLQSMMPLDLPAILGRDVAGTVTAVGPGTQGFQLGDRVMGLVSHSYAEFLVAKADALTRIPEDLGFEDAAALPLVTLTGAQLIEKGVRPQAGQIVLVTGAVGGVGRTAVYVAKKHGAKVVAGVRASQMKAAEALGADRCIAIDEGGELGSLGKLDAIADTVGHDAIIRLLPYIRSGGVLATVLGKPKEADGKDFRVEEIWAQPDAGRLHSLAEAVAKKEFFIPISRRMKLSQIREAQTLGESGGSGKIILIP